MRKNPKNYLASENLVWQEGHTAEPKIEWKGSVFHISDFRNFRYRDDESFEGGYESREFDLEKLTEFQIFSVPFWLWKFSHLIGLFLFEDGKRLCLSVEARRRPGESFSVAAGFLFHFGLTYVWGSDEDILGIRLLKRRDPAIRYVFSMKAETAKAALKYYLGRTDSLSKKPEHYHSLLKNCTTELLAPFSPTLPALWRIRPSVVFSARFHNVFARAFPSFHETAIDPSAFALSAASAGFIKALDDFSP